MPTRSIVASLTSFVLMSFIAIGASAQQGDVFDRVTHGTAVSEGGVNAAEAAAVAEAVLRHARDTPGETLGVAAFSVVQRDAILLRLLSAGRHGQENHERGEKQRTTALHIRLLRNVGGDAANFLRAVRRFTDAPTRGSTAS